MMSAFLLLSGLSQPDVTFSRRRLCVTDVIVKYANVSQVHLIKYNIHDTAVMSLIGL